MGQFWDDFVEYEKNLYHEPGEIWKDFVQHNYRGHYQVSNFGGARRYWLNKRHGAPCRWKYYECKPGDYGAIAGVALHRAIWMTFVGPIPEDMLIRHLNDIPSDNRLCNLDIGTPSDNVQDMLRNNPNWRNAVKEGKRRAKALREVQKS